MTEASGLALQHELHNKGNQGYKCIFVTAYSMQIFGPKPSRAALATEAR